MDRQQSLAAVVRYRDGKIPKLPSAAGTAAQHRQLTTILLIHVNQRRCVTPAVAVPSVSTGWYLAGPSWFSREEPQLRESPVHQSSVLIPGSPRSQFSPFCCLDRRNQRAEGQSIDGVIYNGQKRSVQTYFDNNIWTIAKYTLVRYLG